MEFKSDQPTEAHMMIHSVGYDVFKLWVKEQIEHYDGIIDTEFNSPLDLVDQQQAIGARKALRKLLPTFETEIKQTLKEIEDDE